MNYGAGLFPSCDQEMLKEGAATMPRLAKELLAVQKKSEEGRHLDDEDQQEDSDDPV
jgi:hypothetical protein